MPIPKAQSPQTKNLQSGKNNLNLAPKLTEPAEVLA